jgi:hypothetical protein
VFVSICFTASIMGACVEAHILEPTTKFGFRCVCARIAGLLRSLLFTYIPAIFFCIEEELQLNSSVTSLFRREGVRKGKSKENRE